ncbi:Ras GTPase, partial [Coemansia sp. RSA 2703]
MSRLLIPEYKVVMLGSGGVGKSMLTTRFINGNFTEDYDPTIEDSYRKQCEVDDMTCVLDVLDTAGQEEYIALRDYHIRSGNCFVIVYSILSKATLNEAEAIANKIFQTKNTYDVPIVLVGNKCDCASSRKVTPEEGREVAKRIKSGFYEASAKEGIKVDDIFTQCVRRTKHFNKQIEQSGTPAATSSTTAQHSREPSTQTDKTTGFEKLRSSTKSWLPGRKSLSREKASAVNSPDMTPSPQVTVLPNKRYDSSIPDYYLESYSGVTDRPAT